MTESLLAVELPRRWSHVQGVAAAAQSISKVISADAALLADAAILHDIGYATPVIDTGFHPIDGARYLRRLGVDERIVNLVAHHSCACIEAELRELKSIIDEEFPFDPSLPHAELCFCDMTTSPVGEQVTIDDRLAEIRKRYDPNSIVLQFLERAEPELRRMTAEVASRLPEMRSDVL